MLPIIGKLAAIALASGLGLAQGLLIDDPLVAADAGQPLPILLPLAVLGGLVFGYNFKRFWWLATLSSWVPLLWLLLIGSSAALARLFDWVSITPGPVQLADLILLGAPVLASLISGWLGARIKALTNLALLIAVALAVLIGSSFMGIPVLESLLDILPR